MRLHLFIAMAALAVGASSANAQTVSVQAGSYADFRQLLSREAPTDTATIAMTLRFPDQARDRYPAVVIVHTIAGYQEPNEGWHADEFRKAGFATLTYRALPRGGMLEGRRFERRPWASAVAEAYAALRLLANDPRIDASRIAIVGFSFGGEVAHLARFRAAARRAGAGRDAVCRSCRLLSCGCLWRRREQELHGRADPDAAGREGRQPARRKGGGVSSLRQERGFPLPIEVSIYPGAYHAWTVPSLGAARFYPQYPSTRKCPYLLLGPSPPCFSSSGREAPMDPNVMQTCLKEGQGYAMAYDAGRRGPSPPARPWPFLRRRCDLDRSGDSLLLRRHRTRALVDRQRPQLQVVGVGILGLPGVPPRR